MWERKVDIVDFTYVNLQTQTVANGTSRRCITWLWSIARTKPYSCTPRKYNFGALLTLRLRDVPDHIQIWACLFLVPVA
jgi:hypothetical protein